jgi:uncharacterized protein YdhG (YjbR/CyaY superfamily)
MAETFTKEEREAMKQAAAERRRAAKREKDENRAAQELQDAVDAIAAMPDEDRAVAELVHRVVTTTAPQLGVRTWYGFPAYTKDGKVLAFVQPAAKFGTRYCTLGFQDPAALDDGEMWATSFAVVGTGQETERRVAELIARAAR